MDHLTNVFNNWIVSDKVEKVELDCKGDMNTIIHDITYKINDKR